MKKFRQITIDFFPLNSEPISELLWRFDLTGITETETGLIIYCDVENHGMPVLIKELLNGAINDHIINRFTIKDEILEDKNWNEEYEKNVKVTEVGKRLVIKPTFKNYTSNEDKILITIDPKMSFGTGEHETTKLILTLLEKFVHKHDRVLDVGSGTGILAIASVMLGADHAIGIDNDEWCLFNGKENVKLNKLNDKVEIRLGELSDIIETDFDLVVANINKHILLEIGELLITKTRDTGILILSGILETDEEEIMKFYSSQSMILIDKLQMNEWLALVFQHL